MRPNIFSEDFWGEGDRWIQRPPARNLHSQISTSSQRRSFLNYLCGCPSSSRCGRSPLLSPLSPRSPRSPPRSPPLCGVRSVRWRSAGGVGGGGGVTAAGGGAFSGWLTTGEGGGVASRPRSLPRTPPAGSLSRTRSRSVPRSGRGGGFGVFTCGCGGAGCTTAGGGTGGVRGLRSSRSRGPRLSGGLRSSRSRGPRLSGGLPAPGPGGCVVTRTGRPSRAGGAHCCQLLPRPRLSRSQLRRWSFQSLRSRSQRRRQSSRTLSRW